MAVWWNVFLFAKLIHNKKLNSQCFVETPVFSRFGLFFLPRVHCICYLRNNLGRSHVIRILEPADFRQIERAVVWPKSIVIFKEAKIWQPAQWESFIHITCRSRRFIFTYVGDTTSSLHLVSWVQKGSIRPQWSIVCTLREDQPLRMV